MSIEKGKIKAAAGTIDDKFQEITKVEIEKDIKVDERKLSMAKETREQKKEVKKTDPKKEERTIEEQENDLIV